MHYWSMVARRTLKGALARNGLSYKRLSLLLEEVGERVSDNAIAHRVSRGAFSFEFFLKVAKVAGIEELDLTFLSRLTPPPDRLLRPVAAGRSQLQLSASLRRPGFPTGAAIDATAKKEGSVGSEIRPSSCVRRIVEIASPKRAE